MNATRTALRPSLSFLHQWRRSNLPREPVEARLLLAAERAVEAIERRLHDIERLQRCLEPLLHRSDAAGRRQVCLAGATRLEVLGSAACGLDERFERGRLRL